MLTFIELGPETGKDTATLFVSGLALVVSLATFIRTEIRESLSARDSRVKALQGEKEAVAYVAYKIRSRAWDRHLRSAIFRDDVIMSLGLAFLMEGTDRAKALVYSALGELIKSGHREQVATVIKNLRREMKDYQTRFKPLNFQKRVETLENLSTALGLRLD